MNDSVAGTFAAAADTILPGSSNNGIHVEVMALLNSAMDGYPALFATLLDAFAADVAKDKAFSELSDVQRSEVLTTMMGDDALDVRDVVDALFLFVLGQNYSEAHPDAAAVFARIGYHGPSLGEPDYA